MICKVKDSMIFDFVNATMSGLKVEALVDTGATHNFVSEQIATTLHHKPKSNTSTFKVVNLVVKPT
jgi:predicted aspartyl protease